MIANEYKSLILFELDRIEIVVNELVLLNTELQCQKPTTREVAAAGAFLAQFYGGIENILKLICRGADCPIPQSDLWHIELFETFCEPTSKDELTVFSRELAQKLSPYRKFRHVALHSYAFQLDWQQMHDGVRQIQQVFTETKASIMRFLNKEP